MKLSCITGCFRDRSTKLARPELRTLEGMKAPVARPYERRNYLSLKEFIEKCAELGFKGVDLEDNYFPETSDKYLESLRDTAKSLGIEIVSAAIHDYLITPENVSYVIDHAKEFIKVGSKLGANKARILYARSPPEVSANERFELRRKIITECLPDAKETGICMVMEGGEPMEVATLVRLINSDYFKACIDFTHSTHLFERGVERGPPTEEKYTALQLLAPYAGQVHAKSYAFDEYGEETSTSFRRAFATMKAAGYDDVITVEYEGGSTYEECLDGTKKTLALVKKYW